MTFDVIGVELHEAGYQEVAAEILAADGGSRRDIGDAAAAQGEAAVDHLVAQDDAGVAENLVAHGVPAGW